MKKDFKYNIAMLILLSLLLLVTCNTAKAYDKDSEAHCLAKNIYFEAGNQPLAGRIAVGQVTINRKNHGMFPHTICEVVLCALSKYVQVVDSGVEPASPEL